jgi:hypothetical protein
MEASSGEPGHKGLDVIFDNILIYVEHTGSVMTEAEYLTTVKNSGGNPEPVTRETMTAGWGTTATVVGTYRERGVHANGQCHRRGRLIDTWIFQNKTWVCVAAQATLLQL